MKLLIIKYDTLLNYTCTDLLESSPLQSVFSDSVCWYINDLSGPQIYYVISIPHLVMSGLVSSVRRALASKLRGLGFKSQPGTVGGPVTIIMWGARTGWKLALS